MHVQLLLCYMLIIFFRSFQDFYSRTFNFAIFFTIKEREIEDPSKISTSKIFVPVSSNKVFVQE